MNMLSLTPHRFKKAKPILDRYRDTFQSTQQLNAKALEQELKDSLELGPQVINTIMIDLLSKKEYVLLAARYMESGEPNVSLEFMIPLAKLYRVKPYHSPDREEKKRAFWKQALEKDAHD